MQRPNAAACLLFVLLSGARVYPAAGKVKIHVVHTHTGVKLGSEGLELATEFDRAWSRCSGNTGTYSRELGFYCGDSPSPKTQNRRVDALFYDVQVIMPDATRLVFHCSTILDANCQGLPEYPETTSVVCSDFAYSGTAYKDCTASGPAAEGIGVYQAALHGDRMTIFGPNWQRSYLQYGTWHFEGQDPQNPAQTHETKPAPIRETQDTKPSAPNPKPVADNATDVKAPGTAGEKAANPPVTANSPLPAPEHVIDPNIIEQAKAGDPKAQYKLGYDYYLGRGVPLDYVQAAIWWRKAADQGYPEAQNNLGVLYHIGRGVPQNYSEAYFWQNLAAARVGPALQAQFAKNRDESGSRLWTPTRLKVQQRAAKWDAEHPVPARSHEPADAKHENYP